MKQWVDLGNGRKVWRSVDTQPIARSDMLPVPNFISDTMEPTEHLDGKFYTSKSRFREITKAHDCVEIGNDPARLRRPTMVKPDKAKNREALKQAEYMVANGIPVPTVK